MKSQKEHTQFDLEERALFISRFRLCAVYMVSPLILLFALVDTHFPHHAYISILWARLLSIPVSLLCLYLYRIHRIRSRYYMLPAHLMGLYLGCYAAYLVAFSGFEASPYYATMNLVGIAAFSFLPWSGVQLFVSALLVYGPYLLTVGFGHPGPLRLEFLLPHLAFCISTLGIGVITNLSMRSLRRREMDSRLDLREEIATKDRVIAQKTSEGVFLERLACHFSPQIIEGVKAGRLSLEGLAPRDVTSIFIDVESSTNRSVRLDQSNYTRILSDFFSSAISILLKHDVTVANYLGDGLLAFTNAPEEQVDHRQKALDACLDILKMHHSRQRYYVDRWRTNFNIRIGIDSGSAFVGFFPSFRLGTYTAIGASVNLASRLCSRATANSILVTKTFLTELGERLKDLSVKQFRSPDPIKGFEGEQFELCTVKPKISKASSRATSCALCQKAVEIRAHFGDYHLVRCTTCGYSDLVYVHRPRQRENVRANRALGN